MMGKTHMAVAMATYCGISQATDLKGWAVGAGITLATSLLPDIDEPRSRIGGIVMPLIPSWLRPLAFLIVGSFLIWIGWKSSQWSMSLVGASLLFFVWIKHRESPSHGFIGLVLVCVFFYTLNPQFLLPALIGYGSHLLLDLITEGVSLLWPISTRIRIPLLRTNSWIERWIVYRGAQLFTLYCLGIWMLSEFKTMWWN